MQTPDAPPVVQPDAGGPGGHAAKGTPPMFTDANDVTTTGSTPTRNAGGHYNAAKEPQKEPEMRGLTTSKYLYGYTVALEPGEAAPDFANHADVEEADTGWDKIERVNRIAYTTMNQEVAEEHGFALLDVEDVSGYTSWGTFDCDMIEYGEYVQVDGEGNPVLDAQGKEVPTDIYADEGAASVLEAHARAAERQAAEAAAREAQRKAEEAERRARLTEILNGAGIEPTDWSLDIANLAVWHVRDLANGSRTSRNQRKFSTHYDHPLYSHPAVKAARAQGEVLVREAQAQQARLEGAAKSALHVQATRILDAVRTAVQS